MSASYLACLAVYLVYCFLTAPLYGGDTDFWYHLSGGRYLFEHGAISGSSYFSFLTPERLWYNYYWLFQGIIYGVFSFSGYTGIIIYRLAIFFAFAAILYLYLFGGDDGKAARIYRNILFVLSVQILMATYLNTRPYGFSFLFIVLFIYVLEHKKRMAVWLPLAAVLWVNIHGVEYPVMLLIVFAYLAETLREDVGRGSADKKDLIHALSLIVCAAAIFLTPGGIDLIKSPFKADDLIVSHIIELRPLDFMELFTIHMSLEGVTRNTLCSIFSVMFIISIVQAVAGGKARISHLLLSGGAMFLLFKGTRFTNEFVLLTLPLVRSGLMHSDGGRDPRARITVFAATALLAAASFLYPYQFFSQFENFSNSSKYLPHGVVRFLKETAAGGKVMNYPLNGGFYRWELYPRYKIFADMEVPFLFTGRDIFTSVNAYNDAVVLEGALSRHNPDFVAAPLNMKGFDVLMAKHGKYVRVFFDDSEVLYVNGETRPDVARRYGLAYFNPYDFMDGQFVLPDKDIAIKYLEDLDRVYHLYPEGYLALKVLSSLNLQMRKYDEALRYADAGIKNHGHLPDFYEIRGEILLSRGIFAEAAEAFERAVGRSSGADEKDRIRRRLWLCYASLGKTGRAYRTLRKTVNVFSPSISYAELYNLGVMARTLGKEREAVSFIGFAYLKVPDGNAELKKSISAQLPSEDK